MIKKAVSFLCLWLLLMSVASAQAGFGFKLGSNLTRIVGEDAVMPVGYGGNSQPTDFATPGLAVGLVVYIPSMIAPGASDFVLKNELIYSQKGGRWSDKDDDAYIEFRLDYVEVASSFSFLLAQNFGVSCGLYSGYLVGAKQIYYEDGDKMIDSADSDDLDDLKSRFDYGVSIGGTCSVNDRILLGLDYSLGLVNFLSLENDDDPTLAKNSGFQVSAVYFLKK